MMHFTEGQRILFRSDKLGSLFVPGLYTSNFIYKIEIERQRNEDTVYVRIFTLEGINPLSTDNVFVNNIDLEKTIKDYEGILK
jgi:hypothetical protein